MTRIVFPAHSRHDTGLIGSWESLELAKIEYSASPFIWWNQIGDVLLYHLDTLQWFSENVKYRIGLFANPEPPINGKVNSPWIFWPRRSDVFGKYHALKSPDYSQRQFNCAFIGGYENCIQRQHRQLGHWKNCCDLFDVFRSRKARAANFTNQEYARLMRQSRFGLCLPGYGVKCQREIECLALGTVPIFTPGVSTSYFDKLRLGVHYLLASSPEEVDHLVRTVSVEQWREMSQAGQAWYRRNVTPEGSYDTTKRIIESLENRPTVASP